MEQMRVQKTMLNKMAFQKSRAGQDDVLWECTVLVVARAPVEMSHEATGVQVSPMAFA